MKVCVHFTKLVDKLTFFLQKKILKILFLKCYQKLVGNFCRDNFKFFFECLGFHIFRFKKTVHFSRQYELAKTLHFTGEDLVALGCET